MQVVHDARGEVGGLQHPDVVAVDRLGLLLVEARRVRVDVDDVERGDQLVEREDVAVGADRPAEQRQVVEQPLVDEALLALQEEVGLGVALGELLVAGLAEDERHVREARDERRHAGIDQRAVQRELPRGRRHEVLAADDVGDAHERVVDGVHERVERHATGAHQHEVGERAGREGHLAADEVDVRQILVGHRSRHAGSRPSARNAAFCSSVRSRSKLS